MKNKVPREQSRHEINLLGVGKKIGKVALDVRLAEVHINQAGHWPWPW